MRSRSFKNPHLDSNHPARICCEEGQRGKLCHGALTVNFRVGCSSCSMTNSFVTNAVLIRTAVSCWHLHQLISQTTQYLDSWLSDWSKSELKMKLLEVEGGHVPQCPIAVDATVCTCHLIKLPRRSLNFSTATILNIQHMNRCDFQLRFSLNFVTVSE